MKNNVTLNTLNTTDISASNITVGGKILSSFIRDYSTGSVVSVDRYITDGVKIATISVDSVPNDIYVPINNYTSFEVYATSTDIAPGTESDIPCEYVNWDSNTAYKAGQIIKSTDGNSLYECILGGKGKNPETESTYWKKLEIEFPAWDSTIEYNKYEYVKRGEKVYCAKANNVGKDPSSSTDEWQEVTITYTSPIKNGNLIYVYGVPASMTEEYTINIVKSDTSLSDVIIDWGDGETTNKTGSVGDVLVSHTYATPGKYIVKIHGPVYRIKWSSDKIDNVSRIFDSDLPISKNLCQIGSDEYSKVKNFKMLKVVKTPILVFDQIPSLKGLMAGHYNLHSYTDNSHLIYVGNCEGIFYNCKNLKSINVDNFEKGGYYVSIEGEYSNQFNGCISLVSNIQNLFSFRGNFGGCQYVNLQDMFKNCKNMTFTPGTEPTDVSLNGLLLSKMLFENNTIEWGGSHTLFSTVSDSLKERIPGAWKGE